jgi:hypothetical protein
MEPWPFLAEKRAMPTKVRGRPRYAKKAPGRGRNMDRFLFGCVRGSGRGFHGCRGEFFFSPEPVVQLVTVLAPAGLIEFVRTQADLL